MAGQHAFHRLGTVGIIQALHRLLVIALLQVGVQDVVHLLVGVPGGNLGHVAAGSHSVAVGGRDVVGGAQGLVAWGAFVGVDFGEEVLAKLNELGLSLSPSEEQ